MLYFDTKLNARQSENQLSRRGLVGVNFADFGIYPLSEEMPTEYDAALFSYSDDGTTGDEKSGFRIKWKLTPKSLEAVKPVLLAKLAAKKHAIEDGGLILANGVSLETAAVDRSRVADLMLALTIDPNDPDLADLEFKTASGWVPVTKADVTAIYSAMKGLTLGVFKREGAIAALVEAATTGDKAIAVYFEQIDKGWPKTDLREASATK